MVYVSLSERPIFPRQADIEKSKVPMGEAAAKAEQAMKGQRRKGKPPPKGQEEQALEAVIGRLRRYGLFELYLLNITSAFYSCIRTGMHRPTCMFWANLTPFSMRQVRRAQGCEQARRRDADRGDGGRAHRPGALRDGDRVPEPRRGAP
jgi:hypothetical protein